ncbi:MAG: DUF4296 domain-containing protein [Bacteroidales bacterium]|nr:DUF4296 domain-containing protein [Bacteroidales bacterium]
MNRSQLFLGFLVFIATFCSCSGHRDEVASSQAISADSVIEPAKMVLILSDVHVVEAALVMERNEGIQKTDNSAFYYRKIFEKYHITRNRYDQSLAYYRQDPEFFSNMYGEVIRNLEERQNRLKK